MKLLLYCTKAKPYLVKVDDNEFDITNDIYDYRIEWDKKPISNGKIVVECDFEVEVYDTSWNCVGFTEKDGLKKSCLTMKELVDYVKGKNFFYAIHIKNLHIFDEPKYIQDYSKNENPYYYIENAPQNMMYAYDVKSFTKSEKKVLISIHPQWLCKILNGEKTIEVRKKVLKEMMK